MESGPFAVPVPVDLFPQGGEPLEPQTRMLMETRLGGDFSDIRVHTDSQAAAAAKSINAEAYTSARDIYFGPGKYAPRTTEGQHLLAHELTHTVQQGQGSGFGQVAARSDGPVEIGRPEDPLELEAERIAEEIVHIPQAEEDDATGRVYGRAVVQRFVQRQQAPGAPDSPAPGTLAPAKKAPPSAGSETVLFEGATFSTDHDYVRYFLGQEVIIRGEKDTDAFVKRFLASPTTDEAQIASQRRHDEDLKKYGSDVSGAPNPQAISEGEFRQSHADLVQRIIKVVADAWAAIQVEDSAFLTNFENTARDRVRQLLATSKERIESEQKKYGISQVIEHRQTVMRGGGKVDQTSIHYTGATNEATQKMLAAAAQLRQKRDEVARMENFSPLFTGPARFPQPVSPVDPRVQALARAKMEYEQLRAEKEAQFPILAAYAQDEGKRLDELPAKVSPATASVLGQEIFEKLDKIETVTKALDSGELAVWSLPQIIAGARAELRVEPGSIKERLVNDRLAEWQKAQGDKEAIFDAVKFINFLLLGVLLVAAIPTGGASLVPAGAVAVAQIGAAATGAVLVARELSEYSLKAAVGGTDFDKALAISQGEEPSLLWLALSVVGTILDIGAAASAFRSLVALRRAALLGEATAAEELVARGNAIKEGVGQRLLDDAQAARKAGTEAGAAAKQGSLVDSVLAEKNAVAKFPYKGHTFHVLPDGRVVRCSAPSCATLEWLFEDILGQNTKEARELREDLADIKLLPPHKQGEFVAEMYERLARIRGTGLLSDAELTAQIARRPGGFAQRELEYTLYRRQGGTLSFNEWVEESGAGRLTALEVPEAHLTTGTERHHPFFKYLLRAINKASGAPLARLRPQDLVEVSTNTHRALIHELWDDLYPELARGQGASSRIGAGIKAGTLPPPDQIADQLEKFYKVVLKDSPDQLKDVLDSIADLRSRTKI
jgi:hypothetical protein